MKRLFLSYSTLALFKGPYSDFSGPVIFRHTARSHQIDVPEGPGPIKIISIKRSDYGPHGN
ncbi:hypothetical protein J6590_082842 [Homalodisca vitripennis]|nr:hypothetical protein J6590_082842 [Homalodisca vitripennis]